VCAHAVPAFSPLHFMTLTPFFPISLQKPAALVRYMTPQNWQDTLESLLIDITFLKQINIVPRTAKIWASMKKKQGHLSVELEHLQQEAAKRGKPLCSALPCSALPCFFAVLCSASCSVAYSLLHFVPSGICLSTAASNFYDRVRFCIKGNSQPSLLAQYVRIWLIKNVTRPKKEAVLSPIFTGDMLMRVSASSLAESWLSTHCFVSFCVSSMSPFPCRMSKPLS